MSDLATAVSVEVMDDKLKKTTTSIGYICVAIHQLLLLNPLFWYLPLKQKRLNDQTRSMSSALVGIVPARRTRRCPPVFGMDDESKTETPSIAPGDLTNHRYPNDAIRHLTND